MQAPGGRKQSVGLCLAGALLVLVLGATCGGLEPAQAGEDSFARTVGDASAAGLGTGTLAVLLADRSRDPQRYPSLEREVVEGLVLTGALTYGLKQVVRERRPYPSTSEDGFPSAHASLAFALARVVGEKDNRYTMPAYALATAVGWSRVRTRRHTTQQVVAGALLGWATAGWVMHRNRLHEQPQQLSDSLTGAVAATPPGAELVGAPVEADWGLPLWRTAF